MISREVLENELLKYNEKASTIVSYSDRDRRLVSAYRSFVRFNVIKQKRGLVLDDYIFTTLGKYLCESPKVSYESFKIISSLAPPSAKKYFSAKSFLMFPRDQNQCIDSEEFVRYIEHSMDVENTLLNLMDVIPPGSDPLLTYVTEQQLESFILQMIPEIDVYQRMHESFYEYYACTSSQRFLFYLDTRKTNMISIKKLAHSTVMDELLSLRRLTINAAEMNRDELDMQLSTNWFSEGNAVRLYSLFLELDKDQNGMLSMNEISQFAGVSGPRINFTANAWKRLFDENITYQPFEMDYKGFVNLVLALENPSSVESIRYFWRILDIDRTGRLTAMKIKYFYRDIYDRLYGCYDAPSADHVVVEIFDILSCNTTEGATIQDMIASKQGHTVITMLLDVNGFWRYDNRESLMGGSGDEEAPELQPPPPGTTTTLFIQQQDNNNNDHDALDGIISSSSSSSSMFSNHNNHDNNGNNHNNNKVITSVSSLLSLQLKQRNDENEIIDKNDDDDCYNF